MFNGFNRIKTRSKKASLASITFSNPSLVTTTIHNVDGVDYRVFEIKGNTTANSSAITTTATLYNESNITIYYLVVGSGGGFPSFSSNIAPGGSGGGGLLEGNTIVSGNTSNKTINFSVGSAKGNNGNNGALGMESRLVIAGSYSICAGGGLGTNTGGMLTLPNLTVSTLAKGGGGAGGKATSTDNGVINDQWGGTFGGGTSFGNLSTWRGGGGGSNGGSGGAATSTVSGAGGPAVSVSLTTKGIYQLFTNTSYYAVNQLAGGCGGGTPGVVGTPVQSMYGKGSASSADNSTNRGIIVIAISVSDIPP
jgi:hypothetical protein